MWRVQVYYPPCLYRFHVPTKAEAESLLLRILGRLPKRLVWRRQ